MKKTKKALASLAIAGMVLSMAPASVFGADDYNRIYGANRYLTSIEVAKKAFPEGADVAVIAAGNQESMVDALAAAPFAAQKDAPILLTDKNDMNDDVKAELKKLGVKKVYVVGAAGSKAVVDELKAAGLEVEKIQGKNRVETAQLINDELEDVEGTFVVGYNGIADAMSVASYAAAKNYAIVVANQDGTVAADIVADYVVGGKTLVKDMDGAERLAGKDRYETNAEVVKALDFEYGKVYVANGLTLADALVASVLAAQTDSAIALSNGNAVEAASVINPKLTADSKAIALGGTAVVSDAALNKVSRDAAGVLTVDSVSATSAKTLAVKFSRAVADTSNISFEVKQDSTSSVTISVDWNDAKNVATLSKSSNFVEADYTVSVKDGERDLGSKNVTISEQKIAKIDITSDKLGVTGTGADQIGYATYKIFDQYEADITNSALANNVEFQTGVGTIEWDKGLIKITPSTNLNLLTFSGGIVISGHDTSTGVTVTKNLAATSQIGTLSDFVFKPVKNLEVVAGDTAAVTYLDYTATDISGNETKNYELLEQGLIFINNDKKNENFGKLTTSHPQVTAELVQDPADSKKGLIKVTVNSKEVAVDMPGVITAMTWTGKTSQIDFTLKKQAEVAKLKLYAPSEVVAHDESKKIPFTAYDQNGKEITKFADLEELVTLTGAHWERNVDGTASIKNDKVNVPAGQNSVTHIITSVVKSTGDYSSLNLRIQKPVEADGLKIDDKVVKTILQAGGATQVADLGWDEGGFSVVDQYGRDIDMTTLGKNDNYAIKVEAKNKGVIDAVVVDGEGTVVGDTLTNGERQVKFTSNAEGTGTVVFTLLNNGKSVDSKSLTFTSIKHDDIKDYRVVQLDKPIYAQAAASAKAADLTEEQKDYKATVKVYGLTSAKADVVLAGNKVVDGAVSTSDDFVVYAGADGGAYDDVKVVAKKPVDATKTEASGYITVTVRGADGHLYPLTTPISSSTAKPAAESLDVKVKTEKAGIERDEDVVTITGDYKTVLGDTFAKFKTDGSKGKQNVYFAPKDQYGKTGGRMAQFSVLTGKDITNIDLAAIKVDRDGTITYSGTVSNGQYMTVSATTPTGLVKTIKIVFNNPTGGGEVVDPEVKAAEDAVVAFEENPTVATKADAQAKVDLLPAGAIRAALQARIDAVEIPVGENEIAGKLEPTVFGYALVFTVDDGTKVTKVTKNGTELTIVEFDYVVEGDTVRVSDMKAGDIVKVTVDDVEYTVIF